MVSLPYDPLTLESNYILRMQHKRLGLGDVSRDIFPIKTNDSIESFPICLSYIPCDLTEFMDMEQMVVWSSGMRLIGSTLEKFIFKCYSLVLFKKLCTTI